MKIGIAQINTTVGDLPGNTEKIINAYHHLCQSGAELVVFPELTITGYPPRDLLHKDHFIENNYNQLKKIVERVGKIPALIGYVERTPKQHLHRFYNAVAWCQHGQVLHNGHKCLLPAYEVFEEDRYFEGGKSPIVVELNKQKIGVTICEDIWTGDYLKSHRSDGLDPVAYLKKSEVDVIINLSSSPWDYHKHKLRVDLVKSVAHRCNSSVVYCNQVGGNDELIFDGRSFTVNKKGEVTSSLKGFEEDLKVVDLNGNCITENELEEVEEIHRGLVLGLKDYVNKVNFQKAVIGLSGGIDSAVTAAIAVTALGAENVIGVAMPSKVSSSHSIEDALQLAKNLGVDIKVIPIHEIVNAKELALTNFLQGTEPDTTEENLQARARGSLLMGIANKTRALVLATGNKSEIAMGYCTLYGDMVGGVGVLSDVFKTKVYKLAHYINRAREVIPENTIIKAPSAELKPDQKDEDTLPPYEILDEILCLYIEKNQSAEKIIENGFDSTITIETINRVNSNEYKRKQAAPGLRISQKAFGIGRRMPIVQKFFD